MKFTSIVSIGELNDFASWPKSKNGKNQFTFSPHDSLVEEEFKENYEI